MSNLITRGLGIVGRLGLFGGGQIISGSTKPLSGTSGTPKNCPMGSAYLYTGGGYPVVFVNEGTKASPYWTPASFSQLGVLGVFDDFRGPSAKPLADSAASLNAASGMRVYGGGGATTKGVQNTDSGVTKGTDVEGSHVGLMATTNEDESVVALGMGTSVAQLQPDTHGPLVVDVTMSMLTDILTRRLFVGFLGEAADELDPVATGATTVVTFSAGGTTGDDMAGLFMDANLTAASALSLIRNKSNAAATITTVAAALATPTNLATAGTYQRFRVEVDALGNVTAFVNKVQVGRAALALDVDEELHPAVVLMVESGTTIMSATVKQFSCWGLRS
jgi:hypothetical protein